MGLGVWNLVSSVCGRRDGYNDGLVQVLPGHHPLVLSQFTSNGYDIGCKIREMRGEMGRHKVLSRISCMPGGEHCLAAYSEKLGV